MRHICGCLTETFNSERSIIESAVSIVRLIHLLTDSDVFRRNTYARTLSRCLDVINVRRQFSSQCRHIQGSPQDSGPICCWKGKVILENIAQRRSLWSLFQMTRQDYHESHVCLVRIERLICPLECTCWVCVIDVDRDPENSKDCAALRKVHRKMICEEHVRNRPRCCPQLDEDSVDPMAHLLPASPRNKESVLSQPIPSRSMCSFSSWEIVQEEFGWLPLRVRIFIHPRVVSNSFFLFAILFINQGWIASKVCLQCLASRSRTQAAITLLVYSPFFPLCEQLLQGVLLVVVQIEIMISLANLPSTDLTNESVNETVISQPLHVNCHALNAFEIG